MKLYKMRQQQLKFSQARNSTNLPNYTGNQYAGIQSQQYSAGAYTHPVQSPGSQHMPTNYLQVTSNNSIPNSAKGLQTFGGYTQEITSGTVNVGDGTNPVLAASHDTSSLGIPTTIPGSTDYNIPRENAGGWQNIGNPTVHHLMQPSSEQSSPVVNQQMQAMLNQQTRETTPQPTQIDYIGTGL